MLLTLNHDVLSEILGLLAVQDLVMVRQVCHVLLAISQEHSVWDAVYRRSKLLVPSLHTSPQPQARDLEHLLIRSAQLSRTWGPSPSRDQRITRRFTFPRQLPAYSFDAQVISGRYLQLAEQDAISWYDLEGELPARPLLTFKCDYIAAIPGFVSHQANANGEGEMSVWVSFISSCPMGIVILKLWLGNNPTVTLHATLPADSVVEVRMAQDYILPIREFALREEPLEILHLPSLTTFYVPRHASITKITDLAQVSYLFTPEYLVMLLPFRSETHIEVHALPEVRTSHHPVHCLHRGIYPHMISRTHLFNGATRHATKGGSISFLSIVYPQASRGTSPNRSRSQSELHLWEACLNSVTSLCEDSPHSCPRRYGAAGLADASRKINITIKSSQTLPVVTTASLASTSHNGTGYALAHPDTPGSGPVRVFHIQENELGGGSMVSQPLTLPSDFQSRDLLSFDGSRGRVCLSRGSAMRSIEVLDYA